MSGICGIVNFDGAPVDPELLHLMAESVAYYGPEGIHYYIHENVGLGHLLRYNTPEAVYERQPLASQDGQLVLTARARLDNREELCAIFEIPHPQRPQTPDGELIIRAYQKWGEDCPDHLLGDWCFAVWDARQRKLFLARDHHGNTGLCYYANERFLAFSIALKSLLALPQVPKQPNMLFVAQRLVSWQPGGEITAYEDIKRLPPAHCLAIYPDHPQEKKARQYWYLENAPEVRYPHDEDYVQAFLEIFNEAVRCRLRSHKPVGVTLSGGLDSSSVAALAARQLGEQGKRLPAFTSVPIYDITGLIDPKRFGDELPYAQSVADFTGNIDLHPIGAEEISPLQGIQRYLELCQEPGHAAGNAYWIDALLRVAQNQGLGTLLTGQGGNATISWNGKLPEVLRGLIKAGRLREYWRAFQTEKDHSNLVKALKNSLVRPLIPDILFLRYLRLRTRLQDGKTPWRKYSAIHPDFARQLNLTHLMAQYGHDPTFSGPIGSWAARYAMLQPDRSISGLIWMEKGAGYNLEVRDPTLDKQIIEFCLGLPEAQYIQPGISRYLIRRAMQGMLPPEVLWNKCKGIQAADIGDRVLASCAEIQEAFDKVGKSTLAQHILDIPYMSSIFQSARDGLDAKRNDQIRIILLRGLMMGLFLLHFQTDKF